MSLINEGIDNGNGMNVSSFQSGLSYAAPDWSPPNERPIRDRLKPISLNPGDNDPIHLHSVLYFLEPTFFKQKKKYGRDRKSPSSPDNATSAFVFVHVSCCRRSNVWNSLTVSLPVSKKQKKKTAKSQRRRHRPRARCVLFVS